MLRYLMSAFDPALDKHATGCLHSNRAQMIELSPSSLRASAAGLNKTQLSPAPDLSPGQQPGGPVLPANSSSLKRESNLFQLRMCEWPLFTAGLTHVPLSCWQHQIKGCCRGPAAHREYSEISPSLFPVWALCKGLAAGLGEAPFAVLYEHLLCSSMQTGSLFRARTVSQ